MADEPQTKRAIAFFDGQNLFHMAKKAFGYPHPNYDPIRLAELICHRMSWSLTQIRFYTGIHEPEKNAYWNRYWTSKLGALGRRGAIIFSRPLRYREKEVLLPDGSKYRFHTAEEKGIDVRIAIDVIRMAHTGRYDVALIFSQDQDLTEAAREVRVISQEQRRWIKIASAFPQGTAHPKQRGIYSTDWIPIEQAAFDRCLDPQNYGRTR